MTNLLAFCLIITSVNATIIMSFKKWNLFELYQVYIHERGICLFCFGFWLAVLETLLTYLFFKEAIALSSDIFYIAVPFACASITEAIHAHNRN